MNPLTAERELESASLKKKICGLRKTPGSELPKIPTTIHQWKQSY